MGKVEYMIISPAAPVSRCVNDSRNKRAIVGYVGSPAPPQSVGPAKKLYVRESAVSTCCPARNAVGKLPVGAACATPQTRTKNCCRGFPTIEAAIQIGGPTGKLWIRCSSALVVTYMTLGFAAWQLGTICMSFSAMNEADESAQYTLLHTAH